MTSLGDQDEALATLQGLNDVWLDGKTLDAHIQGVITGSSISRAIDTPARFSLTFNDTHRVVAQSGIFGADVSCVAAKYPYSCISISKTGRSFEVQFEDKLVAELQKHNEPYVVKAGILTHVEFVERLLKPFTWLKFKTVDDPHKYGVIKSLTTLSRGTPAGKKKAKKEGTWAAINRIGQARGWRTFVRGVDELWYVPDTYLFDQPLMYNVSEDDPWIDSIDYSINIRARVAATCTITARAAQWAIPAGSMLRISDAGPSNGKWIVSSVERSPITNPQATITLIHPTKPLPEPRPNATSSDTSDLGGGAPISSNPIVAVAQYAIGAGFTGHSLQIAVQVAMAESGGNLNAVNHNTNGTTDRGLWQINSVHTQYAADAMFDGAKNAKAAFEISNEGRDWTPWTTFNTGAYIRFASQATRAIAQAKKLISEGGSATVSASNPGITGSKLAADFILEVLAQKGKTYVLGASDPISENNPHSFDCSSLMQYGAGRVGVSYPRTAEAQYEWCRQHGTTLPIGRASHIRGAVLFAHGDDPHGQYGIGHTAMSMGNGRDTFEALGTGYGVNEFHDIEQFLFGALIPGMKY